MSLAADARRKEEWLHSAALMALLANCHRNRHTPAYVPDDFNPLVPRRPRGLAITAENIDLVIDTFLKR